MTLIAFLVMGLAWAIATRTTSKAAHYGASGMVAGMATMMAAMGTGLSVGYAAGMVWELGWANLVGVLAGFTHGLVMGRRYGPMAALDGAGGGVMGGLMGPMLGVMLLYLPISLVLTAILMLVLQTAFSLGAVYLVAAAAGAVGSSGVLYRVGQVLGADYLTQPIEQQVYCPPESPTSEAGPAKRPKLTKSSRSVSPGTAGQRRPWLATGVAVVSGALFVLILSGGAGLDPFRTRSSAAPAAESGSFAQAAQAQPTVASVGQDGVQELKMTLRYPRYEPNLMEVKAGVPVRLTLEAIGNPG